MIRRIRSTLHANSLDHELAAGADPGGDPTRRARAELLLSARTRDRIAEVLERLVADARKPRRERWSPVPVRWDAVQKSAGQFELLASRLRQPDPVSPQGVARANLLLTEGTGPLYGPSRQGGLWTAIRSALVALDLGPALEVAAPSRHLPPATIR